MDCGGTISHSHILTTELNNNYKRDFIYLKSLFGPLLTLAIIYCDPNGGDKDSIVTIIKY